MHLQLAQAHPTMHCIHLVGIWCYRLGVTHTAAASCPLCSKTYSALVWSLMVVLQIGCYPYCCCTMPTLLRDIFCLGVVTYAGATDWVLPILLVHHAHFAPRHILPLCGHTYAGATDWVLPILLLHHAHFVPRHILPWCGHLCWCYILGVTHTAAASFPLCSKTYSAFVWSLMLVLLIGCYHTAAASCPLCSRMHCLSWCSAWAMLLL